MTKFGLLLGADAGANAGAGAGDDRGRLAGQPVPRVVQEAANANKKDTLMAAKESQQELVLKNTMDSFLTSKTKNKREFLSCSTFFA